MVSLGLLVVGVPLAAAQSGGANKTSGKTFEYTVQPGDTCARIAERFFGNKRRWDLIHANNPDMGPAPHRLAPGSVLILPVVGDGPDARLTDVRRIVQARAPKDPGWERARAGKELYRGWRVNTLERASADVTFQDGSTVQMRQNTLIVIYGGVYSPSRRRTTEASLERGTLRSRLGELRLDVKTPTAEAGLQGGSSVVSVDDQGTSYLSHHKGGEARFKLAKGEAVRVKSGFGSKAREGDRRPTKPRPLPPAPKWRSDGSHSFTGVRPIGGSIQASWLPVKVAVSYRLEVASSRDGKEVVVATSVPSTVTDFEIHRLPDGEYFARVSTIDGEGFESAQSEPWAMTVGSLELQSPGEEAGREELARSEVSDEPPPTPTVLLGTRVVSPDGFRCGTDQRGKAASFVLAEAGSYQLSCVGSDGAVSPKVEVMVVAPSMKLIEPTVVTPIVREAEPRRVTVALQSELPVPEDARFRVPAGVTLREVSKNGDTRTLELSAAQESPDEFALELVTGPENAETVLASVELQVAEPEKLDFAPNEALALTLSPDLIGLANDRREGSGAFSTIAYVGDPGPNDGYWRLSLGAEIAPVRRLRLGLAIPIDLHTSGAAPTQSGDQDILAWTGYQILARDDFSVDAELSVWFPTGDRSGSIGRTRFVPTFATSYVFNQRWLFRTRQGAILATSSGGPFFWTSAYGLDIKVVRLFAISGELDVFLGRSSGQVVTGVGGGPGLSLLLGPARIYFAARFSATDDFESSIGKYTLTTGLRVAFR